MGKIEVGGEYTGYNGYKWKCIFVDGDRAWMTMDMESEAYVFKIDGTNIKFFDGHYREGHNLTIRFPIIDGTPDWSSAKVTGA